MIDRASKIPIRHGVDRTGTRSIVVAPSILSADFGYLADEVQMCIRDRSHAGQALSEKPNMQLALRAAATSNALAGRIEEAQKVMARLRQIDPALRVSNLIDQTPLQRPEDLARYAEGMRKAGLPE